MCTNEFSLILSNNSSLVVSFIKIYTLLHILSAFDYCTLIKDALVNLFENSPSKNYNTVEPLLRTKLYFSKSKMLKQKLPSWIHQYLSEQVIIVDISSFPGNLNFLGNHHFPKHLIGNIVVLLFRIRLWYHSFIGDLLDITKIISSSLIVISSIQSLYCNSFTI